MKEFLKMILLKPFIMLGESPLPPLTSALELCTMGVNGDSGLMEIALEPMLLATTLYMSYIYGIVYLLVSRHFLVPTFVLSLT